MTTIVKEFPTLYANSNGKPKQWIIRVISITSHDGSATQFGTEKEFGLVDGKKQTTPADWIFGKNIGKSNETTPEQQALLEAEAQWVKKQTGAKGYTTSLDDANAGIKSDLHSGGDSPMLAHTYGRDESGVFVPKDCGKIVLPCFGQPKLNGNRLIAKLDNGKATLTSRDGKLIMTVPHIAEALEATFPNVSVTFDGEMYNHEFYEDLEMLRHMIAHGDERVQYHIYDIVDPSMIQGMRFDLLKSLFGTFAAEDNEHLHQVATFKLATIDGVHGAFMAMRNNQYEGLILRNMDGEYTLGKRSYDLQKYKGWLDREFEIVDVVEKGKGKDAGKAKFVCITCTDDPIPGVEFKCDIATTQEKRAELWENRESLVGKWLTVRFSYHTKAGKPFHMTGLEIRDEAEANQA